MAYQIQFYKKYEKDIAELSKSDREALKKKLEMIKENPRCNGVEKLNTPEPTYRIRFGNYRLVFQIQDQQLLVLVVKVGHRRDIYS